MTLYSFKNDYSEGAHPRILRALLDTNMVQDEGYGEDQFSLQAVELLKERMGRRDVDIHLLPGGTQTNFTAISAFLRPHEAVISASTGHICVHETGAVEATGHKVITVSGAGGKLSPAGIQEALDFHTDEHMVRPKLAYISNSTEIGTIYSRGELEALNCICREHGLYLFMDGARLGSALTAQGNDLDLRAIAQLVDAFYIGGTKNGALIGEALVICRPELKEDFRFIMKQRGAMLAKGRLIGLQFLELFRDGLFFDLARHANGMAGLLREGCAKAGLDFLTYSPSNQLFPILSNTLIAQLQSKYDFYVWSKVDHHLSAIRLVTSWATREEAVRGFLAAMNKYIEGR